MWWLLLAAWAGGPEDAVRKLLVEEDFEKARQKCDKSDVAEAEGELRDLCARAFWPEAEAIDTVAGWAAYRARWTGTRGERPARDREAAAALREAGGAAADEATLLALATSYAATPAGDEARALAGEAAVRGARTATDVARVVREHPDAPGLDVLVKRFLADLVVVTIDGDRITARPRDGLTLPGDHALSTDWVTRDPDGRLRPWDDAAQAELVEEGIDPAFVRAWRGARGTRPRAFPLCWNPQGGVGQAAGARVSWGGAEVFVDQGLDPRCGKTAWPVWVVRDGRAVAGLSLAPGHYLPLATGKGETGFPWNGTSLYLPDPPSDLLVVQGAAVFGQRVGRLFLVHPLAGGMPWLTSDAPPDDSLRLTGDLASISPPPGWGLQSGARGAIVEGPGLLDLPAAERVWTLPPGEVRTLSPLAQEVTAITRSNPKLGVTGTPPLEKGGWRTKGGAFVPEPPGGADALVLAEVDGPAMLAALDQLTAAGLVVVPSRGWRLDFDDDPNEEVVIEATIDGLDVRIVVDPYRTGAVRTFVFDSARPGTRDVSRAFAFERGGVAYVAFTGTEGGMSYVEALHFDARGLIREVARK